MRRLRKLHKFASLAWLEDFEAVLFASNLISRSSSLNTETYLFLEDDVRWGWLFGWEDSCSSRSTFLLNLGHLLVKELVTDGLHSISCPLIELSLCSNEFLIVKGLFTFGLFLLVSLAEGFFIGLVSKLWCTLLLITVLLMNFCLFGGRTRLGNGRARFFFWAFLQGQMPGHRGC